MGTDDRPDPHLSFLELTDQIVEDLAMHNLKAREKLREGIAWLEARREDAESGRERRHRDPAGPVP